MELSLIVTTYNSAQILARTLPGNLSGPWVEIVIVDGFSTDGTKELVAALAGQEPPGRIVFHQILKKGLANARNAGTMLARGEYIMHAGPDNVIPVPTLEAMRKELCCHDLVSCETELVEFHSYWDRAHGLYKKRFAAGEQSAVGTPYIARRTIFELFPFDEGMLNSDDTELCARLRKASKRIYRCPETCLEYGFTTIADFKERWMRWGRGDALFYKKMKSGWSLRRRAKSLLRPFFAELIEPKAKISWSQYLYTLPFLLMVFSLRYYGWIRYVLIGSKAGKT